MHDERRAIVVEERVVRTRVEGDGVGEVLGAGRAILAGVEVGEVAGVRTALGQVAVGLAAGGEVAARRCEVGRAGADAVDVETMRTRESPTTSAEMSTPVAVWVSVTWPSAWPFGMVSVARAVAPTSLGVSSPPHAAARSNAAPARNTRTIVVIRAPCGMADQNGSAREHATTGRNNAAAPDQWPGAARLVDLDC